ncbi:MAG: hypothetical protein H6587_11325 [Flavobacteriales bacterium]|nr:hypothetical protein [Flavobacteriales bacterium]MCB9365151.1 hypothetical protein [Flavobacteriales bacterium]
MATGIVSKYDGVRGGNITQDLDGSIIEFIGLLPSGVKVGDPVSYDIENNFAININAENGEPADEGTVETGTINGDLNVGNGTYTLKGATVTGNVEVKGGRLLLKSGAIVKGNIDFKGGTTLEIYNSTVKGNIDYKNSTNLVIQHGDVEGDMDIKNSNSIDIQHGDVEGDMDIKGMQSSRIQHGDQSGNIVGGSNSGCN